MKCGLIGEKLGHSYSRAIHQKLGAYDYHLYPLEPKELRPFLTAGDFDGLNVTIPYKEKVAQFCHVVDPLAESLGAINTLYFKDGLLHGTNTDYLGFIHMVRNSRISLQGKKIAVLGSGGASKTIVAASAHLGARNILVATRSSDFTASIRGATLVSYNDLPKDLEIIINTTPVGMSPHIDASPLDISLFPKCQGVLDLIYNPVRTRFLLDAESMNIPTYGGLSMLVAQATASAEYFTGNRDSNFTTGIYSKNNGVIQKIIASQMENIVLIGMPGCGKSLLAKELSSQLGRPLWDTDFEILKKIGKKPSEIIVEEGEAAFRTLESQIVAQVAAKSGYIISTGGGIVTLPRNIRALRQNGYIIWVQRDIQKLSQKNRPLSSSTEALKDLYIKRAPLYNSYADIIVDNNGSPQKTLAEILGKVAP